VVELGKGINILYLFNIFLNQIFKIWALKILIIKIIYIVNILWIDEISNLGKQNDKK
jgi:hypothetical protein